MVKNILTMTLFALLSFMPTEMQAQELQQSRNIETEQSAVSITVDESTLHVRNAAQTVLVVYDITGKKVYTCRIDSPEKAIDFSSFPRGYYIVKVGKVARKVYLK